MTSIYLERRSPEQKMWRFYSLEVSPTLFGSWALIRRWGRIGSKGRNLEEWFDSYEDAWCQAEVLKKRKIKRGYLGLSYA